MHLQTAHSTRRTECICQQGFRGSAHFHQKTRTQAYAVDDTQSCRNLTLVLAYCYSCGLLGADCCFSFLQRLTDR